MHLLNILLVGIKGRSSITKCFRELFAIILVIGI